MRTLPVHHEVTLSHRAYRFAAADNGACIVSGGSGAVTIFAAPGRAGGEVQVDDTLRGVAAARAGDAFAVLSQADLRIFDVNAARLASWPGVFDAAWFAADGSVWTIRSVDAQRCLLEVRVRDSGDVLATAIVSDPYAGSNCSFHPTRPGWPPSLWLAAGQDGQAIYWTRWAGDVISVERLEGIDFATPPCVHPDGGEMLLIEDLYDLAVRSRDSGELLRYLTWPYEDDEFIGSDAYYVSAEHALVSTNGGRLFLVELAGPSIVDEVCVAGHEPKPVRELYPRLDEDGLAADFSYMVPCADYRFVSAHSVLPSGDRESSRVLWWDGRDLFR